MKRLAQFSLFFLAAAVYGSPNDARLFDAVKNHDTAALRALVKDKAAVNSAEPDGMTPLLWSAYSGDAESARLLLAAGASVKAANRYGVTALSAACTNGDATMVGLLLKAGANPNTAMPPTMSADFADVPVRNPVGETVLMTASRTGNADAVKMLLDAGADVNLQESWRGQTALMWAAAEDHPEVVRLLVAKGADVNVRTSKWDFPDHKPKGADPLPKYGQEPGSMTALLYAARQGSLESARVLLSAGAKIDDSNPGGVTPLTEAIMNGHYDVAGLLIEKGANVNDGGALFEAIELRNWDLVDARPGPRQTDKLYPLDIIAMLLDKGADPNASLTVNLPPKQGVGRAFATVGSLPLIRAAKAADVETLKLLFAKGADAKVSLKDHSNALMAAAGQGYDARTSFGGAEEDAVLAIQLLLDHGADINAASDTGATPLHYAAQRGANGIVQFLAGRGADVWAKNKQGKTPRDIATGIGTGFGGSNGTPHPATAELLQRLMEKAPTARN